MVKRSPRRVAPVPSYEEALAALRDHVRVRWYEVRTPEKIDRAARMLAGSARGLEMHLAADMTARELLEGEPNASG